MAHIEHLEYITMEDGTVLQELDAEGKVDMEKTAKKMREHKEKKPK